MNYHEFWDALEGAYPLSKGTLRLPIATTLTPLSEVLPNVAQGGGIGYMQ